VAEAVGDAAANLAAVANKPLPGEASANALLRACFDGMADASPAAQDCAAASLAQVCSHSPRKMRNGATQSYADAKTDVHTFRELGALICELRLLDSRSVWWIFRFALLQVLPFIGPLSAGLIKAMLKHLNSGSFAAKASIIRAFAAHSGELPCAPCCS